jgi:class 3 adenylate cyclase
VATQDFKRKLTAILSADVKGYSRLMGEDEEATVLTLTAYRAVISTVVQKHRGRVVDSPGDNVLAEFASVVDAVGSAVEIQAELKVRNAELPKNRRMEFRIGINLGDVIHSEGRIYGDGVNVAARVESLGEPGGICISRSAYDQVKNKLTLGYEYLGEHSVKNIDEQVRIYRVLTEPEAAGKVIVAKRVDPRGRQRAVFVVAVALLLVAGAALLWQFKMRTPPPATEVATAGKPSITSLPARNPSGDPIREHLKEEEKKREEEKRRLAEKRESLRVEEEKLKADRKRYEEWMQRLEFEKQQSEEAREKLASIEKENSAEYQKRLEAERRLHEEMKRLEVERERLEKEKQGLASIPKTVTSTRVSLRAEPQFYSDKHIEQMLKKYNFFENGRNALGSFKNDFVNNGDGTITDRATGLMWQKNGSPRARSWDRGKNYLNQLNKDRFAGYSDWRLPTIEELASLVERRKINGVHIDPIFDEKQKTCWSSDTMLTRKAFKTYQTWIVNFAQGVIKIEDWSKSRTRVTLHPQFDANYHIRAVRSLTD